MNAYIIASSHSGIPNDLREVFPQCTIKEWHAGKRELTGNPAKALKVIEAALKTAEWVSYDDVANGILTATGAPMERKNFNRTVIRHRQWNAAIAASPFMPSKGPRGANGFRLKPPAAIDMAA